MSETPLPRAKVAEGVALAVLLAAIVLRAITSYEAFPLWSEDPTVVPAAITSFTPAGSLLVDAVMLLAAGFVLALAGRDGRTTPLWMTAAASIGVCGAMLHAFVLHATPSAFQLDHLALGASWSAGIFAALAIRAAAMDPRWRAIILACLVGVIGPLAAKGVVQVFIEHPQTLAAFNANKSEMLAVRGWSEDSPMARAFIRRLSQPEASGWTGLSNVYSSFAAFACLTLAACLLTLARTRAMLLALFSLGVAGTALALSKSKGGISSALVVGLPILGASVWLLRMRLGSHLASHSAGDAIRPHANDESSNRGEVARRILHRVLLLAGLACIAIPLLAVVVRGLVGERLSELSLLFRWFYMQGAARIFAQHLPVGVGPDGFQEAYLLAKPLLSPEAVASPHNILWDWLSTLGLFGVAWCVLLVTLAMRVGKTLVCESESIRAARGNGREKSETNMRDESPALIPGNLRADLRVIFLVIALPTVLASWIETPGVTIEGMAARFAGIALAMCIGSVVLAALRRDAARTMLGVAAGALAVLAHTQIELTGVNAGSCAWLLAVIAAASAKVGSASADEPHLARSGWIAALASFAIAAGVLAGVPNLVRWEWELRIAAREVAALAEANVLMRNASKKADQASLRQLEAAITLLVAEGGTGTKAPTTQIEIERLADRVLIDRLPRAEEHLAAAARILPSHFATHQALSRVRAQFAEVLQRNARRDDAVRVSTLAITELESHVRQDAKRAAGWSWLATLTRTHAAMLRDDAVLAKSCEALEKAATLDPHAITYPSELARTYARLGLMDDAKRWSKRALENNANMRLDPLQGLTEGMTREMETIAR